MRGWHGLDLVPGHGLLRVCGSEAAATWQRLALCLIFCSTTGRVFGWTGLRRGIRCRLPCGRDGRLRRVLDCLQVGSLRRRSTSRHGGLLRSSGGRLCGLIAQGLTCGLGRLVVPCTCSRRLWLFGRRGVGGLLLSRCRSCSGRICRLTFRLTFGSSGWCFGLWFTDVFAGSLPSSIAAAFSGACLILRRSCNAVGACSFALCGLGLARRRLHGCGHGRLRRTRSGGLAGRRRRRRSSALSCGGG
mmetsp:Transcript_79432/g.233422  ORF Transcript_79432/g.233422 Transcript_79432/m.233422 type:complete len:245 (-) Transcript_79432:218-952(-)